MLGIYPVVLTTLSNLKPALRGIERRDRDLGRQMRRAATSVALNLAEGMYSRGKNQAARYHTGLGSAWETLACLEVAEALGYVHQTDAEIVAVLNRIVGTLVGLVRRSC